MALLSNHFPGYFASKTARTVQKFKEKVGLANKLEDRDFENLQKMVKHILELNKKPSTELLNYIGAFRQSAVAYDGLCKVLRDVLTVDNIGDQDLVAKLTVIQNDIYKVQADFLVTLDELSTLIRNNLCKADVHMSAVKAAVQHCQNRRLDSVLVNKRCGTHNSLNLSDSEYSDLDSSTISKTFPKYESDTDSLVGKLVLNSDLNTSSDSTSGHSPIQDIAVELYRDAKAYAKDIMQETIFATETANFEMLALFQPQESAFEVVTTYGRGLIMSIFHDIVKESPVFTHRFDVKHLHKTFGALKKELLKYSQCLVDLSKAKANFHEAIIATFEGDESTDIHVLKWFPDSKRDMVGAPIHWIEQICRVLDQQRQKLEAAQTIQHLLRTDTDFEVPIEDIKTFKKELPKTLQECLRDLVTAEQIMQDFAEYGARRFSQEIGNS